MGITPDMNAKTTNTLRVLAADDHWIARAALINLLQSLDRELEVHEAADFEEALAEAKAHPDLDLILIDLVMPGMHGTQGLQIMRDTLPGTPIVVVSVSEDRNDILNCVNLGAMGYVPKTANGDEILKAIKLVLAGEVSLPRRILEQPTSPQAASRKGFEPRTLTTVPEERLTQRQRQIFELLSEGLSNAEIAQRLDLSINTVRVHIHGILQRLQLENRMQVVLHAANQRQLASHGTYNGAFGGGR